MIRFATLVVMVAMVAAAVGLYRFKESSAEQAQHIDRLRAEIAREQRTIDMLRAEWTYLNTPSRIQGLADRHLELERVGTSQIATIDALPLRPIEIEPLEDTDLGGIAGTRIPETVR